MTLHFTIDIYSFPDGVFPIATTIHFYRCPLRRFYPVTGQCAAALDIGAGGGGIADFTVAQKAPDLAAYGTQYRLDSLRLLHGPPFYSRNRAGYRQSAALYAFGHLCHHQCWHIFCLADVSPDQN